MIKLFSGIIGIFGLIINKKYVYKAYLKELFKKSEGIDIRKFPDDFFEEIVNETLELNKFNEMIKETSYVDIIQSLEASAYRYFCVLEPDLHDIGKIEFFKQNYENEKEMLKKYNIL